MNELRWIAVPRGALGAAADGSPEAVLRVLVVPRLDPAPTVAASVMAGWPATLAGAQIALQHRHRTADAAVTIAHRLLPGADDAVWERFFGPAVPLPVAAGVIRRYEPPTVEPSTDLAGSVVTGYANSAQTIVRSGVGSPAALHAVDTTVLQFASAPAAAPPDAGGNGMAPPDFHRVVAMLREHPNVLIALGLVFELALPAAALDHSASPGTGQLRVVCPSLGDLVVSPWSSYELSDTTFLPAPGASVRSGRVDLTDAPFIDAAPASPSAWAVASIDIDGAVRQLQTVANASSADGQLPPLRSAGLQLLHRNRAATLTARTVAATANAAGALGDAVLDADDLVLGYRIDVKARGGAWRSLHERAATYTVAGESIPTPSPREEGHIKPFSAVRYGDDGPLLADEVVARWSGWSLAVHPPEVITGSARRTDRRTAAVPFDFDWSYDVPPGSLPNLRFGQTYRMRMRVADAAGGGLGLTETVGDSGATAEVTYLRYEPIPPPTVVGNAQLGPGSGELVLVIRSDPQTGLDSAAFAAAHPGATANDVRELRAPAATVQLVEQHRLLDGADEATWAIVRGDLHANLSRTSDPSGSGVVDPASGGVLARVRRLGAAADVADERSWSGAWPQPTAKSIELVGAASATTPVATWTDDDHLRIALAAGAEATVTLSSFMRDGYLDQFEVKRWLANLSTTDATGGRHPMVTPVEVVRCVHAVRRPPPVGGSLVARDRTVGQTFVDLDRAFAFDVASTAQIDIAGSWDEWHDDPSGGTPPTRETVTDAHVTSIVVDRDEPTPSSLRHELGDTRYRRISYSTTAIGRFREYFAADEPADAFRATSTLPPVEVASTSCPPVPSVAALVPAFLWQGRDTAPGWATTARTRNGNRLRVELARPWFITGDQERIGVLVAATPGQVPTEMRPFVSWCGRDPMLRTPAPAAWLSADRLRGAAPGGARTVALPEAGPNATAVLVPFDVTFDGEHWFADIGIDAGTTYSPMVQLALVRYQPHSAVGLERSTIVLSDIVNMLPDRTLSLSRNDGSVDLVMSGEQPSASTGNVVEVFVEQADAPTTVLTAVGAPNEGVSAWTRVPGASASGPPGATLTVQVPGVAGRATRLYVREVESLLGDPGAAGTPFEELSRRVVFADHIDLT